ncbi:MAG: hypothetical protein V8S11_01700 [Flavonifractor plautii]
MPHVYAVILILMLLVTIMTYVIPAGTYARVDGNVDLPLPMWSRPRFTS